MKDYNINQDTLALIPLGKKKTIVYEDHNCFIVDQRISKLMDEGCKYNGSSIEGRTKSTYSLTGYLYKAPIILNEESKIIFFPTSSPRLNDCAWINSSNINKIYDHQEKCLIEFNNHELLEIETSYNIINNQINRSLQLEKNFKKRNN